MAEVTIYHHLYNKKFGTTIVAVQPADSIGYVRKSHGADVILRRLSIFSAVIGIFLILSFYAPKALALSESFINLNFGNFGMTDTEVQMIKSDPNISKPAYEPAFDPSLPATNRLIIPSIGVTTDVQEATLTNYEDALRRGVWRVSDFGAPNDRREPIILAAHRFGYLAWTDSYRRKNSFYNLPKVKVGDIVEINWSKRKYLYGVYAVSKGVQILDYSADLILYTCETLTGDTKIFVYARLI